MIGDILRQEASLPSRTWLSVVLTAAALVVAALVMRFYGPPSGPALPNAPGAPPVGPRAALLVVHGEWRAGADASQRMGRYCPDGSPLVHAEVETLREVLARVGYALDTVEAAALDPAAVATYALVVHHNGGWGSSLTPPEVEALRAARAAGRAILFLGDDAAAMAAASPEVLATMGVKEVRGNGRMPVEVRTAPAPDEPTFPYAKEPDEVELVDPSRARAWEADHPVAWTHDRVAVANVSLRSSDLCPVTDEYGAYALKRLVGDLVREISGP